MPYESDPHAFDKPNPTPKAGIVGWWNRRSIYNKIALGCLAVVVALTLVGAIFFRTGEPEARAECQATIRSQLKAPSSATFDYSTVDILKTDDTHWTIIGHVTAKNSFGVDLDNRYRCVMVKTSNGWTVDDSSIS